MDQEMITAITDWFKRGDTTRPARRLSLAANIIGSLESCGSDYERVGEIESILAAIEKAAGLSSGSSRVDAMKEYLEAEAAVELATVDYAKALAKAFEDYAETLRK